jgi:hypothetical protein
MADTKETRSNGFVRDEEILGDKAQLSHEEAMHFGVLTEEELAIEKKLVRKIDMLIMPCVVTIYLMNYIDRYALPSSACKYWLTSPLSETTMLLPGCKD